MPRSGVSDHGTVIIFDAQSPRPTRPLDLERAPGCRLVGMTDTTTTNPTTTRRLGARGPHTSALGIGTWALGGPWTFDGRDAGWGEVDDDVVTFGQEATRRGGRLVLFTDPYLSPLSSSATVLLTTGVDGPPPFLTLAPALAVVEALVAGAVEALGPRTRRRLEALDRLAGR